MTTEIKPISQKLGVTECSKIVVTEVETVGGSFTRAFRFFGSDGPNGPVVLEVVVTTDTKDNIGVKTPELNF